MERGEMISCTSSIALLSSWMLRQDEPLVESETDIEKRGLSPCLIRRNSPVCTSSCAVIGFCVFLFRLAGSTRLPVSVPLIFEQCSFLDFDLPMWATWVFLTKTVASGFRLASIEIIIMHTMDIETKNVDTAKLAAGLWHLRRILWIFPVTGLRQGWAWNILFVFEGFWQHLPCFECFVPLGEISACTWYCPVCLPASTMSTDSSVHDPYPTGVMDSEGFA